MYDRDALIALYKDNEFKASFIAGYIEKGVHQFVAEKEFSNAFNLLIEDKGFNGAPPISSANIEEIKRTFLAISSYGISFDTGAKEIYLQGAVNEHNKVIITYLLGYRGMKRIISNTNSIRSHNTEIVYEDDSFTWLGAEQRPNYASNGRTQNSQVVCGFTTFTFNDNTVLCHRSSAQELLDIEKVSIQQTIDMGGREDHSIYKSAWRERCLRILTLRAAFREHQHLFLTNKDLVDGQVMSTMEESVGAFEQMLNEAAQEESLNVANL